MRVRSKANERSSLLAGASMAAGPVGQGSSDMCPPDRGIVLEDRLSTSTELPIKALSFFKSRIVFSLCKKTSKKL